MSSIDMPFPPSKSSPTQAGSAHFSKTADPRNNWLLLATGLAFTVIGWLDLALVWLPFNPRSPEWEFGATSGFFDAMPLGTIGLVCLTFAAHIGGHAKTARVLSIVFWMVALLLIGVATVFISGLPLAMNAVQDPAMREILKLSILKTLMFAGVYVSLYVTVARLSWKSATRVRQAARSK